MSTNIEIQNKFRCSNKNCLITKFVHDQNVFVFKFGLASS